MWCGLVLLPAVVSIPHAAAQEAASLTDGERATLGKLFKAAKRAYEIRDYPVAIAKLEAAYQIFPEPSIRYRIAEMYEELGQPDNAILNYRAFLKGSKDAAKREVVLARIAELEAAREATEKPSLARVTLETVPSGASVFLNRSEESQGYTPLELQLEPGDYTIRLSKPGYDAAGRTLKLQAGDLRTFDFMLRKVDSEPIVEDSVPAATWAFGGIGVAAAIASGTFFFLAEDSQSQLDEWDQQSGSIMRPADYQDTADSEQTYRNLFWVTGGVAIGSFATAALFYFLREQPSDAQVLFFDAGPSHAGVRGVW